MPARRLALTLADRDHAHTLAGAIQNLLDPPPDALTLFETKENGTAGWRIDAYYDAPPSPHDLDDALQELVGPEPLRGVSITLEEVPDLNWVALSQAALPPVRAGRFTVHGSHDRARVPQGPGAILIEAGEAFGTAHHATTYGCLLAIDRLTRHGAARPPRHILDLGCGSGVLAIALRRALPSARIIATDLDAPSIAVARENARTNRCASSIRFHVADGLAHKALRRARFDLVVANILAGPLIGLARTIASVVRSGGRLVLSGILVPQAAAVIAAYRAAGFRLVRHDRIHEWSTLELVRDSSRPPRAG